MYCSSFECLNKRTAFDQLSIVSPLFPVTTLAVQKGHAALSQLYDMYDMEGLLLNLVVANHTGNNQHYYYYFNLLLGQQKWHTEEEATLLLHSTLLLPAWRLWLKYSFSIYIYCMRPHYKWYINHWSNFWTVTKGCDCTSMNLYLCLESSSAHNLLFQTILNHTRPTLSLWSSQLKKQKTKHGTRLPNSERKLCDLLISATWETDQVSAQWFPAQTQKVQQQLLCVAVPQYRAILFGCICMKFLRTKWLMFL